MNQKIKLSQAILYVIISLSVILFVSIWPLGIINNKNISKSEEIELRESEPITVEKNGTQMFIAEGSYLDSVDLLVKNDMTGQIITFRLYDSGYTQLWETFHVVGEKEKFPGFIHIPVGLETQKDWEYYYTVEGLTAPLILSYEDTESSSSYANGTHIYGGEKRMGVNPIIRYIYKESPTWWMVLLMGAILAILCKVSAVFLTKYFKNQGKKWEKEITVQKLLQWTLNPMVIVGASLLLFLVFPRRKFGVGIINYGFYYLGILLAAAVLLLGINYKRADQKELYLKKTIKEHWMEWAMAVCFAGAVWSCYEYLNGLYNIHHSYAACKFLTWISLALLFTFKKENLLKLWNLLYVIPAVIYGYYYAKPYVGVVEQEELFRLQARLIIVLGFLVLQLILSLVQRIRKKAKVAPKLNLPFVALYSLWAVLMLVFRNTRSWVVVLIIVSLIFYYCIWNWEKRELLLKIFGNGLILNFLYTVGYCLLHRPYLRFRHNRYGMVYHTVTVTGYYLALILCAITVRLFLQYRKTKRWVDCWKELSLLGIGNVYLFLTLSRTGYLAAFVMEIFMACFTAMVFEKKRMLAILRNMGMMIGVSIVFFPIVFTFQRIVPAISDDPIYSEIEIWDYVVEKGTPMDSELYMDITAFCKVAGNKLFDLDTGNISLSYHELKQNWTNSQKPVYIKSDKYQLASEAEQYEEEDISNGRFDIFTEYIGHWNLTGHELMGVPLADGTMAVHAHNTFLQVIHDHGLVTGIVFIILGAVSFILAFLRFMAGVKNKNKGQNLLLTLAVLPTFALAGMVEWVFHLCNPFGISLIVVITPLLFKKE